MKQITMPNFALHLTAARVRFGRRLGDVAVLVALWWASYIDGLGSLKAVKAATSPIRGLFGGSQYLQRFALS